MVVLVELLKSVSQDVILNITNNVRSRSLFCLQRSMSYGFFTPPFPFQIHRWTVPSVRAEREGQEE